MRIPIGRTTRLHPSKEVHNHTRLLKAASLILLLTPYLLYVGFIIRMNQGPVDYETFMGIGHRFRIGSEVYGENSFYPMPFVMIFALFDWLPRPVSMVVWFMAPVITALYITGWNPFVLVFGPLFGHFTGGQTAIFGMLGLWGYRKNIDPDNVVGGIFLGLMLLKPQLAVIPLIFAFIQWWKLFRTQTRLPRQFMGWTLTTALLFLPGFFFEPDWLLRWLGNPRPMFERALSGIAPRTLLYVISPRTIQYWMVLIAFGLLLLYFIWRFNNKRISLDLAVIWGFVVSPLVHDYDLIQLIPLLDQRFLQIVAVLLSIPGWLVILFAYSNDTAWYAFTIIAPGILCALLYLNKKFVMQEAVEYNSE